MKLTKIYSSPAGKRIFGQSWGAAALKPRPESATDVETVTSNRISFVK
jgi:hypothetical protein